MQLKNMFEKNINRDINGVVKVGQDDLTSLQQELSEYIVTKELHKHFDNFFDNYTKIINAPSAEVGVWISGFFGSGKSHFLKILSYLLVNKEIGGKHVIDYFEEKFDDPMVFANLQRSTQIKTESILFNIDVEGPINKDKTAVLRVFAKVFYNHCGFYGEDLKVAKLEQHIEKQGKTKLFRENFKEINGEEWIAVRDSSAFFEDDIVSVLQAVLDMSEAAARNWCNGEENVDMSIKLLVSDIKSYVENQINSSGKDFRLLFMIDEVGQYIGDDSDLMINLQSIVEELGSKCMGKVWVMVTSQEAIDSVVRIVGDDFSKIQGRFTTNLSLSSSSVDEVIKKRVLAKTADATSLLTSTYEKDSAILKNLYTFNSQVLDIKGYRSATEFVETFPFVPYQFIIMQKVLAEIRKHGNSGKHLSGGERSMLSGFQEAAQKYQTGDENTLIPFYQFYDTLLTFLESQIRRVIDRAQRAADNNEGLINQDVKVLKLLYLIRYIDDITANIDNIAILMIDDIRTDKITLRREVTESLQRLLGQNYIARNGDAYFFLTDEEQDIAIDIRNTTVDTSSIVASIAQTIFNDIYPAKKFKFGKYDFDYNQFVDTVSTGAVKDGNIGLRFLTVACEYSHNEMKIIADSKANREVTIVLAKDAPYFEQLEEVAKVKKYVKGRSITQLPQSRQDIIKKRQSAATILEKEATQHIIKSILEGAVYVHGERQNHKTDSLKDKIDTALKQLVESVYDRLGLITTYAESDADILSILNSDPKKISMVGTGASNEYALNEVSQWLEIRENKKLPTTMGEVQRRYNAIPYGWREIDIAAVVARLIVAQKITIKYGGAAVLTKDKRLVDFLRRKSEVDKAKVTRRIAVEEALMKKAINVLREYTGAMDIPSSEDGLIDFAQNTFMEKSLHYGEFLQKYAYGNYPQKDVVQSAELLVKEICTQSVNRVVFLETIIRKQDDLLDAKDDMEEVETFFKTQKGLFDNATKLMTDLKYDREYFAHTDAAQALANVENILSMPKPYSKIKDLASLTQTIQSTYGQMVQEKQDEMATFVTQTEEALRTLAQRNSKLVEDMNAATAYFTTKRDEIASATSLIILDAMKTKVIGYRETTTKAFEKALAQVSSVKNAKITITRLTMADIAPAQKLQSKEDVDSYVEHLRKRLHNALSEGGIIELHS